jgi:hypothetical protein
MGMRSTLQRFLIWFLLASVANHVAFAQEPSTSSKKNTGLAEFVAKRPFNENTYNDFACMITRVLYDDATKLIKSLSLTRNDSNQYEIVLGDAYNSTQGKSFVVDKQVIVFEKAAPDPNDKKLFVLEPGNNDLQITVATTLHKDDQLLCVKSWVTVRLPSKSKP